MGRKNQLVRRNQIFYYVFFKCRQLSSVISFSINRTTEQRQNYCDDLVSLLDLSSLPCPSCDFECSDGQRSVVVFSFVLLVKIPDSMLGFPNVALHIIHVIYHQFVQRPVTLRFPQCVSQHSVQQNTASWGTISRIFSFRCGLKEISEGLEVLPGTRFQVLYPQAQKVKESSWIHFAALLTRKDRCYQWTRSAMLLCDHCDLQWMGKCEKFYLSPGLLILVFVCFFK